MRTRRAQGRVIASSGIASIVAGLLLATLGPVLAPAGAEPAPPKVTICHATSATDGPYVEISVSQHAVDGGGNEDHTVHAGPVFDFSNPSANQGWGDIVPPFGTFGGLNWSSAGQAVHGNGCTAAAPAPDVCVHDAELGADDVGCVPPVEPCVYDAGLGADDAACAPPVGDEVADPPAAGSSPGGSGPSSSPPLPAADSVDPEQGVAITSSVRGALARTGRSPVPGAVAGLALVLLGTGLLITQRWMCPKRTGRHYA